MEQTPAQIKAKWSQRETLGWKFILAGQRVLLVLGGGGVVGMIFSDSPIFILVVVVSLPLAFVLFGIARFVWRCPQCSAFNTGYAKDEWSWADPKECRRCKKRLSD